MTDAPSKFPSRAAAYKRWQYVLLGFELAALVLLYVALQAWVLIAVVLAHAAIVLLVVLIDRAAMSYRLALTEELLRETEHRANTAEVRSFVLSRRLQDVERDLLARGEHSL